GGGVVNRESPSVAFLTAAGVVERGRRVLCDGTVLDGKGRASSVRHACAKRYSILRGIACLISRNDAVGNGDIRASGNHAATRNGSSRIQTLCCVAGNGAVFDGSSSSGVGY